MINLNLWMTGLLFHKFILRNSCRWIILAFGFSIHDFQTAYVCPIRIPPLVLQRAFFSWHLSSSGRWSDCYFDLKLNRSKWSYMGGCCLTNSALAMPYGNIDQGQHWLLRKCLIVCMTVPSCYLSQHWILISDVLWNSSKRNFTALGQAALLNN